jgi:hypothetical protein
MRKKVIKQKTSPKASFLDCVMAGAETLSQQKLLVWEDRVLPEHRAAMDEIRSAWRSGKIAGPLARIAKLISEELAKRNIATVGPQGVISWLKRTT